MSNEAEKVREVGVWQMVEALTTALRQIEQERDQERARADKAEAALFHNGKHLIHECPPKGSGLTPCCERTVSAASAVMARSRKRTRSQFTSAGSALIRSERGNSNGVANSEVRLLRQLVAQLEDPARLKSSSDAARAGARLHVACIGARPRVSAGVAGRGWLSCDVCEKPWAPYPKRDEALQYQQAAEAAFQRAVGAGYKNPDAAARQARTRKCASFGGFVHGDEGMGCWRCGESRQDHR